MSLPGSVLLDFTVVVNFFYDSILHRIRSVWISKLQNTNDYFQRYCICKLSEFSIFRLNSRTPSRAIFSSCMQISDTILFGVQLRTRWYLTYASSINIWGRSPNLKTVAKSGDYFKHRRFPHGFITHANNLYHSTRTDVRSLLISFVGVGDENIARGARPRYTPKIDQKSSKIKRFIANRRAPVAGIFPPL